MTAELSDLQLTLTQTHEQRLLRVVDVGYSYTLKNTTDPQLKSADNPFDVEIDILGDDVLIDDILARAVDRHSVQCEASTTQRVKRSLIVAQEVLNEDLGDDEIKLRVRVSRSEQMLVAAVTPVVGGKF